MKKLLIIPLYLLASVILHVSCTDSEECNDSCCGESFTQSYFQHRDVTGQLSKIEELRMWSDSNVTIKTQPLTQKRLPADSLAIQFYFDTEYYTNLPQKSMNFSLLGEAYACSPPLPLSEEIFDSINIRANRNYDSLHPAGRNLEDLFKIIYINKNHQIISEASKHLQIEVTDSYYSYTLLPNKAPARQDTFVLT